MAAVVKLADTLALGASERKLLEVQVLSAALYIITRKNLIINMESEQSIKTADKSSLEIKKDEFRKFLDLIDGFDLKFRNDCLTLMEKNDPDSALYMISVGREQLFKEISKDSLGKCLDFINSSTFNSTDGGVKLKEYFEKKLANFREEKPQSY